MENKDGQSNNLRGSILFIGLIAAIIALGLWSSYTRSKSLAEAINQYNVAINKGNVIDICIKSKRVVQEYSKSADEYKNNELSDWTKASDKLCEQAGIQ